MRKISNVIDFEDETTDNVLANLDDVTAEGFRKRFMEKVKDGTLPDDNRTPAEIAKEEDSNILKGFVDWLDLDEEINVNTDNPTEMLSQISQELTEGSKQALEMAEKQRDSVSEEDAAEEIKQIKEFTVDTDDPLNVNQFKKEKDRAIQGLLMMSEQAERQKANERNYQESYSKDTSNRFQSGSSYGGSNGYTWSSTKQSSSSSKTPNRKIIDIEDEEEKRRAYWENLDEDLNKAKASAMNGGGYYSKNEPPPKYKKVFFGKKFRFKNVLSNIKEWCKTRPARVIMKFSIAAAFEMAMAILAGRREFEGKGQMLATLGMIIGGFVIANELMKEGYDPRIIHFG